jgi:hypothetical protein
MKIFIFWLIDGNTALNCLRGANLGGGIVVKGVETERPRTKPVSEPGNAVDERSGANLR